jgi:hypothetical protein
MLALLIASLIAVSIGIGIYAFYYLETGTEDEEESSSRLQPNEAYEGNLNEVHLAIAYNKSTDSFKGIIYNPTGRVLYNVRVEVHLLKGLESKELGPTPSEDLAPGENRTVELSAEGWSFDGWVAHPEASSNPSQDGEANEENHHDENKASLAFYPAILGLFVLFLKRRKSVQ